MEAGDQSFKLVRTQELNLVDKESDPCRLLLSGLAEHDEEIREVVAEIAAVGRALERLEIESARDRAVGGDGDREGSERAGDAPELLPPAALRRDLEESAPNHAPHTSAEVLVLGDL